MIKVVVDTSSRPSAWDSELFADCPFCDERSYLEYQLDDLRCEHVIDFNEDYFTFQGEINHLICLEEENELWEFRQWLKKPEVLAKLKMIGKAAESLTDNEAWELYMEEKREGA